MEKRHSESILEFIYSICNCGRISLLPVEWKARKIWMDMNLTSINDNRDVDQKGVYSKGVFRPQL